MADLDIKKNAESIADLFVSFFEQFVLVLTKPKYAIEQIFTSGISSRKKLQTAVVFSVSSILVGIAFARFVGLPGSPAEVNPETAIAVLLVWVFSAILLHPLLKLFKAKGVLQDTIVVFLLVISSLHLVFIPIVSLSSHLLTDTKVTLTYDYVVYFGAKSDISRSNYSLERVLENSPGWRERYEGVYTETFIKEKEPEKNQSILPPAPALRNLKNTSEVPTRPNSIKRVGTTDGSYGQPKRTEHPILSGGVNNLLLCFWVAYYLINSGYLAIGLSIPHKKSPYFLFSLAFIGPILIVALGSLTIIGYVFIS